MEENPKAQIYIALSAVTIGFLIGFGFGEHRGHSRMNRGPEIGAPPVMNAQGTAAMGQQGSTGMGGVPSQMPSSMESGGMGSQMQAGMPAAACPPLPPPTVCAPCTCPQVSQGAGGTGGPQASGGAPGSQGPPQADMDALQIKVKKVQDTAMDAASHGHDPSAIISSFQTDLQALLKDGKISEAQALADATIAKIQALK